MAESTMPTIVPDVVYGHKAGMALTYDVIQPAEPNGAAVLFMVSGGWVSGWADPAPLLATAMAAKDRNAFGMLLDRGFTLILVRHGSSPYFKVPDAVSDVRRAVRHVRFTAAARGIDPERLGAFGGSAGGHLSLMLGTTADNGNPAAADPVEKVSNRVAAVTAYYPPTDLAGYIGDARFPALHFPADQSDTYSPLMHVTADDAPSLLVHGGRDTLVRPSHSENILAAFRKEGVPAELITFPEAGHHFNGANEKAASTALVAWFEKHLVAKGLVTDSPAGSWEAKATLPDGNIRPATLMLREHGAELIAISIGEDGEERKADRVKWQEGRLLLEFDLPNDEGNALVRVDAAQTSVGNLVGIWEVVDATGGKLATGDWKAAKPVAP